MTHLQIFMGKNQIALSLERDQQIGCECTDGL